MKDYRFAAIKVKIATHRKVRLAASLAGMQIAEWVDKMVDQALSEYAMKVPTKEEAVQQDAMS